jgi:hypothetical protein
MDRPRLGRPSDAGRDQLPGRGGGIALPAEICLAIFASVVEPGDQGDPVNDKHAERRAATWLYR